MKKITVLLFTLISILSVNAQIEVGDATLPKTVKFNNETLTINGYGMREKFVFDIYACGLYLKSKSNSASKISKADETMAIKLHVVSGLMSRSKMEDAFREGMEKSTNGNIGPYKERLDKFLGYIKGEIEVDQVYDIVYEKGKGTVFYKNGKEKGYVTGVDFKEAMFNIWLGNKPVDKGLKGSLLGDI